MFAKIGVSEEELLRSSLSSQGITEAYGAYIIAAMWPTD